jgi:hypothetical protein
MNPIANFDSSCQCRACLLGFSILDISCTLNALKYILQLEYGDCGIDAENDRF